MQDQPRNIFHPRNHRLRIFLGAGLIALAVWLSLAAPAGAVSKYEPIAGISTVSPSQLEAELSSRNPGHIHPGIAQLYVTWGYRFGIRADVAFAQMLHETNYLRYGGDVQPWQNNFAGIGATGGVPGNSFATAELGVIAHYAHLAWYIFPDHVNEYCNSTYDPRHFGETHRNTVDAINDLGGQWAVPGTGYGDALARIATNIWNYNWRGNWLGSFNELQGTPAAALSTTWYFPWYDSTLAGGMFGNWIVVGNQGTGEARVEIFAGSVLIRDPGAPPEQDFWSVPEGGRITPLITNFMGGPVKVVSLDGQPLIASQRVLYLDSFNEVRGIPFEQLSESWEFPWYDSYREAGMNGVWLLVANAGSQPADVEMRIGGNQVALFSEAAGNQIAPGEVVTRHFPQLRGGPVIVRSLNSQPLIASQRVIYRDSFSELIGTPTGGLSTEYLFNWYDSDRDNGMFGDWIVIANRGSQAADVEVYVGPELMESYRAADGDAIPVGGMATPLFPELTGGPVRVVSTNGQDLLVSQRVIFRDSFEEVAGVTGASLSDEQVFSWYDSKLVNFMRGDWILVANQGVDTANVEIYIGMQKMHDPENPGNDFFTIEPGGRITPQFENVMGGPVRVVSTNGQDLMVSQRVLYKDGLSR